MLKSWYMNIRWATWQAKDVSLHLTCWWSGGSTYCTWPCWGWPAVPWGTAAASWCPLWPEPWPLGPGSETDHRPVRRHHLEGQDAEEWRTGLELGPGPGLKPEHRELLEDEKGLHQIRPCSNEKKTSSFISINLCIGTAWVLTHLTSRLFTAHSSILPRNTEMLSITLQAGDILQAKSR